MEQGPRARLLTAVVLVLVFVSGLAVGVALDREEVPPPVTTAGAERQPDEGRRERVPMYMQVGPNEEQKARIDSIVKVHRESLKALEKELRDAYRPRYRALVEQTREAIKGVLNPDQVMVYDSLLADYDRRRAEREEREED